MKKKKNRIKLKFLNSSMSDPDNFVLGMPCFRDHKKNSENPIKPQLL